MTTPVTPVAPAAWQLPAERLVFAIRDRAETRGVPVYKLVPPELLRRYERAARAEFITVDTADLLCQGVLGSGRRGGVTAEDLYGVEEVRLARKAMAARRRENKPVQHWMTRMTLADYQRVWDAMAAVGAGGTWTGVLRELVDRVQVPATYSAVSAVMQKRGWIRVERRGHGGRWGHGGKPSIIRLVKRPAADTWPCANPACAATISTVTPEGTLTTGKLVYCSQSCENAVQTQALGRKLDLLRREAGLPLTGRGRLNAGEVDQVLRLIGQLRRFG